MRRSGQITVFLSMCLLCVTALLCVMLESARTAGSKFYFQVAVNSGLDTLFSRYHRRLWEEYKILGLEYGLQEELERELEIYVTKYLETDTWYPMRLEGVEITQMKGLGEAGGDYLAQEVLSYMKYGIVSRFVIHPEEGGRFLKDMKEAAVTGSLAGMYNRQEREVRRLEKAVENLIANIRSQERLSGEIEEALESDDEQEFAEKAQAFKRTADQYPGLLEKYEKQARTLAVKQQESRAGINSAKPDLQEERGELLESQWNPYDAYLEKDGARYQELFEQQSITKRNQELLEETEILVEELLDYDEEDEEEELSLEPAAETWSSRYERSKINTNTGSGDKKKQNLLDQVQKLAEGGLTKLVMPEKTVISKGTFTGEPRTLQGAGAAGLLGGSMAERVLIDEYCGYFFPNVLEENSRNIAYEMEYLLQGRNTDQENLEAVLRELLLVRQGLNLIHILSDGEKREQARALALVITGGVGLAPLADIAACLIMGVWALGEAIQDLRILMSGGKVPLWKQKRDWNISLEELLDMGGGKMPDTAQNHDGQQGFAYEGYLKLLLLKEKPEVKHMRMLDLMERNIRQTEPGFSMDHCAYYVDIRGKACGKHVFFALPVVENFVRKKEGYGLEAGAEKAY